MAQRAKRSTPQKNSLRIAKGRDGWKTACGRDESLAGRKEGRRIRRFRGLMPPWQVFGKQWHSMIRRPLQPQWQVPGVSCDQSAH
jgi:hypothetical protein